MRRCALRLPLLAVPLVLAFGTPTAGPASVLPLPTVDTPAGGGGSVAIEPVKERAAPTRRVVFSCVAPDLVTFSDRPCGPAPELRELKLTPPRLAAPSAHGGSSTATSSKADPPARQPAADTRATSDGAAEQRADSCRKLEASVDDIDARMRAGYPAREAGRLWDRWREARSRLREADC